MSKRVEIYDQFSPVYLNPLTNERVVGDPPYGVERDPNLTLEHPSVGTTTVEATDLTEAEALSVVSNLYEIAKAEGASYTDRIVKLDTGYAEVAIEYADGRHLNRVIYITE